MYNRWSERPPSHPELADGRGRSPAVAKEKRPPAQRADGLQSLIQGMFNGKLDLSDMVLLLILLLLYMDSKDEDFLIMLIVLALSF
jgi:hypothetical protein